MGKAFGGFLRLLVTLALLGLLGYNTWQVRQLSQEVEALKHARASGASAQPAGPGGHHKGGADIATPEDDAPAAPEGAPTGSLAAAQQHVSAAQAALGRKDYVEASHQMTLAAQAAQKATNTLHNEGSAKLAAFRQAVSGLQAQADRLLQQDGGGGGSAAK